MQTGVQSPHVQTQVRSTVSIIYVCVYPKWDVGGNGDLTLSQGMPYNWLLSVRSSEEGLLWAPAMAQATGRSNGLWEDCAKNQATLDTYIS